MIRTAAHPAAPVCAGAAARPFQPGADLSRLPRPCRGGSPL